jgi:hypothetical protein
MEKTPWLSTLEPWSLGMGDLLGKSLLSGASPRGDGRSYVIHFVSFNPDSSSLMR